MEFSVLISVYSREAPLYFEEALNSVINQTLRPAEIVLVKDGPLTPELDLVIGRFMDMHPTLFKILALPVNEGLGMALNRGLPACSNEIVCRMDTDDICDLHRFEKQVAMLSNNKDLSVLGAGLEEFNKVPGDLQKFRILPSRHQDLVRFAKFRNPLNHPTVAFRKSHVIGSGSYQHMPLFEDYYLWVRMLSRGYKIANIPEPLVFFRVGNDMVGRRRGLSYAIKELNFLKACRQLKFLTSGKFAISVFTKTPLRLLPKSFLQLIYKNFLR